jgi:hypothetical protein
MERAMLLLAYVVAQGKHEGAGSPRVATYEASRLASHEVPEPLRGLVEAARALIFSSGNHCAEARESASASSEVGELEASHEWLDGVDAEVVATDLEYARRLLVDGALACCALRGGDPSEAGRLIDATAVDARGLGLAPERVLLLQTLAATAMGDDDGARLFANQIEPARLTAPDRARLRLLRDAIAASGEHGLRDAALRLAERDWLLSAMLEAVVDAMERDGLLERLESQAEYQVARGFLAAEARVFVVAGEIYPFFEQQHLDR